jgi:predicted lipoprotein with Yx(FWY)xxD motif
MATVPLLLAAAAAAPALSRPAPVRAHASGAAKIELHHTSLGSILTTSSGLTVYEFTRDRGAADSCVKVSGCSEVWPALLSSGRPTAGPGVKASLLSSIRIAGGASQVTYAGHPLYRYAGDSAGDTSYVGVSSFGGSWLAVDAAGHAVR